MRREALLKAIREAWSDAEYPGDARLAGRDDCCGEYGYVAEYFRGQRWHDLTLDHLLDHYEGPHYACMSFMSAHAYAYYLGAMMIMAVEHPEDTLLDSVVFGLTEWWLEPGAMAAPGRDPDGAAAWMADRWGRLSSRQAEAVLVFLEYVSDLFEEKGWKADDAARALEEWRSRIAAPE